MTAVRGNERGSIVQRSRAPVDEAGPTVVRENVEHVAQGLADQMVRDDLDGGRRTVVEDAERQASEVDDLQAQPGGADLRETALDVGTEPGRGDDHQGPAESVPRMGCVDAIQQLLLQDHRVEMSQYLHLSHMTFPGRARQGYRIPGAGAYIAFV